VSDDSDKLIAYIKSLPPPGPFKPCSFYNMDGDQLEVFWDNASYYGKPVNGMCIMLNQDTNEPVGVTVYSLRRLLREAGFELVPIEQECKTGQAAKKQHTGKQ
jgi:hypothetical protein